MNTLDEIMLSVVSHVSLSDLQYSHCVVVFTHSKAPGQTSYQACRGIFNCIVQQSVNTIGKAGHKITSVGTLPKVKVQLHRANSASAILQVQPPVVGAALVHIFLTIRSLYSPEGVALFSFLKSHSQNLSYHFGLTMPGLFEQHMPTL